MFYAFDVHTRGQRGRLYAAAPPNAGIILGAPAADKSNFLHIPLKLRRRAAPKSEENWRRRKIGRR